MASAEKETKMDLLDSRAVPMSLESYVRDRLAESDFFSLCSHHRLAVSFLSALGVDNPARIAALPVTDAHAESFLRCFFPADRAGAAALAALAGREPAVPGRNSIIVRALPEHCGVTSGFEFFRPPADLAAMHFQAFWEAIACDSGADGRKRQRLAPDPAMAGNN
jgi:hypothetical protein